MSNVHISNGEQLRVGIIDYANSKIREKILVIGLYFMPLIIAILLFKIDCWVILASLLLVVSFVTIMLAIIMLTSDSVADYSLYRYAQAVRLLKDSICHFSLDIENKFASIEFFVPSKHLISKNSEVGGLIIKIYDVCMPIYASNNYVIYFELYAMPSINVQTGNSVIDELEKIIDGDLDRNSSSLPMDIKDKGKGMSRAYLMLYCIENTLRLFIESVEKNVTTPLFISSSVRKKIADRKANEVQNKYLSIRGNSDLFYLDFKELGDIIVNNPVLLSHFPNESWVKVKIEELGNIRNLIAHNSYIGELEIRIIAANYESILRQIRK